MKFVHVSLVCSSEEHADKFYSEFLNLKKTATKILPLTISKALFGIQADLKIMNYQGDSLFFEIFINDQKIPPAKHIEHTCLEVGNFDEFLKKAKDHNIKCIQIPKAEKMITFISDFDGNLFEIV